MITDNTKYKKVCTGDKLMKIVGMELCGEVKFANASHRSDAPYFPLTGPVAMGLVLHKRDSHSGFVFETKLIKVG